MLSPLFDEAAADIEVIKSLTREIERLTGKTMGQIIKSSDGKYYRVHSYEEITPEEVTQHLEGLKGKVSELEAIAPATEINEVPANAPAEEQSAPAAEPAAEVASTDVPAAEPVPAAVPEAPAAAEPAPVTLQ